jgi:hypothetical protein
VVLPLVVVVVVLLLLLLLLLLPPPLLWCCCYFWIGLSLLIFNMASISRNSASPCCTISSMATQILP